VILLLMDYCHCLALLQLQLLRLRAVRRRQQKLWRKLWRRRRQSQLVMERNGAEMLVTPLRPHVEQIQAFLLVVPFWLLHTSPV
jgi:hypothetical protein